MQKGLIDPRKKNVNKHCKELLGRVPIVPDGSHTAWSSRPGPQRGRTNHSLLLLAWPITWPAAAAWPREVAASFSARSRPVPSFSYPLPPPAPLLPLLKLLPRSLTAPLLVHAFTFTYAARPRPPRRTFAERLPATGHRRWRSSRRRGSSAPLPPARRCSGSPPAAQAPAPAV